MFQHLFPCQFSIICTPHHLNFLMIILFSARFMDLWAVLGLQMPLFVGYAFGLVSKHKSFLQDSLGGNSKTVMIGRSIFFQDIYPRPSV